MRQSVSCPVPANEPQRVASLYAYDILDSLPEMDFDTLASVAANALKMPAAVIGLMDSERLWFKSQIGLGVTHLDRSIAFCAHAIMRPDEVLVSEDLTKDARFVHNPLVTNAPNLRFYAGAPLINQQGYALGTIAVADTQPRTLSDAEKQLLKDFAKLVILAIESRKTATQLQKLAMTDQLTGLPNRVHFERVLNAEISHAKRSKIPFKLYLMDLDNFKWINDTFGHPAGDEVLQEVSQRMLNEIRAEDLLARLGGDEFGLIVRGDCSQFKDTITSRMAYAVSAPLTLSNGNEVNIGMSIGSVAFSDSVDSIGELLGVADELLYQQKRK
jgi:diguanylate cyclase (GGDEF)-like protein